MKTVMFAEIVARLIDGGSLVFEGKRCDGWPTEPIVTVTFTDYVENAITITEDDYKMLCEMVKHPC